MKTWETQWRPLGRMRRGLAALLWVLASPGAFAGQPGLALYYGPHPPLAELAHFEQVVLEPAHVSREALAALPSTTQAFAYLSVGEVSRTNPLHARLQPEWLLGENADWGSDVVDPLQEGVRALLLAEAQALWARGFRGFFLDTLDSPLAVPAPEPVRQARLQALVELLRELHRRMPGVRLLLNRGFELFPEVAPLASGLVAESLFARWSARAQRYEAVPGPEHVWLKERLLQVREQYGLPVSVIDYVPPAERARAREVARAIQALGFTPYVTNARLDMLGVGAVEVIPRRVLALHDGAEGVPERSLLHQLLAVPLEALGYTLDYRDVRSPLPEGLLAGRYAGVVAWVSETPLSQPEVLRGWLERQCGDGVRVALFGHLGFAQEPAFLARWGLAPVSLQGPVRLGRVEGLVGFEARPTVHARTLPEWEAVGAGVRVHLSVRDASGREAAAILSGPCGGMALGAYALEEGFAGQRRWVLNPFAFLEEALAAEPFPVPDFTTENGRRLLVIQVAGDGAELRADLPGQPPVGSVFLDALLARHALPVSLLPSHEGQRRMLRALSLSPVQRRHLHLESRDCPGLLGGAHGGGLGRLSLDNLSLTGLSPRLGPPSGQGPGAVYAPLVDARTYASLAQPPYAYARLTSALEWTEWPLRLEPLALYYPLQACATPAGLRALRLLHGWALRQPTLPLWTCEYTERIRGFASATLSRRLEGTWQVRDMGALRTLRLPRSLGWPEPGRSEAVAGFLEAPQGRYVSLSGPEARLLLVPEPPQGPRLAWANASIVTWEEEPVLTVRLRGHLPVSLALAGVSPACHFATPAGRIRGTRSAGLLHFRFPRPDTGHARLVCP